MILEVATALEYKNALKDYLKYHHSRYTVGDAEQGNPYIIEGISLKITEPWQFKDEQYREPFGSNVSILDETLPLLGKECSVKRTINPNERGIFMGIEVTEEDCYYMLKRQGDTILYETCCGGIEEVKNISKKKA